MGKKEWSIVDGYRPPVKKGDADNYRGHECVLILNRTEQDAHCNIDIYFEDRPPVKGIKFTAPAERISTFYTDDMSLFGKADLGICVQYSMHITSDTDVVVQYGRMDVNQDNLAYMVTLGYGE
ncbi:MAG: hypothetical protein IJB42_04705 [Oscillospiraceae bacterium]|nr:hypothetical protein [Oscillospiraceae bacterium]MBQ7053779.1 hypothetical protein [Oscillospiraceae bacterium]MBR2180931.1 hypothetical protein [Oscillospiraceae bacterium]